MSAKNVYRVPAVNMPHLEWKIDELNKKSAKLGTQPATLKVVERIAFETVDERFGLKYEQVYFDCTIEGEVPVLNGWTLVAVLQPQPNKEMLIREVPGQNCPTSYREATLKCDHCQKLRRRSAVYILRSETEGHRQVGRNCLKDFLGHTSPESLLAAAEYLMTFAGFAEESEGDGFGGGEYYFPIEHYLAIVSALIRRVGWVSKKNSTWDGPPPTASIAWDICSPRRTEHLQKFIQEAKIDPNENDITLVKSALTWAKAIEANVDSQYLYNLGVACRQDCVTYKTMGVVASVIAAYQNATQNLRKAEDKTKKIHLGQVGERRIFENLKVEFTRYIEGVYPSTLVKFCDEQGNILVWYASKCPEWVELNAVVTIKASVKKHTEFRGDLQTVLTRVTLEEEKFAA
jgi:hypothetical protein